MIQERIPEIYVESELNESEENIKTKDGKERNHGNERKRRN